MDGGVIRQHQRDAVGLAVLRFLEGSLSFNIIHAVSGSPNDVGRVLTAAKKLLLSLDTSM